MTATQCAGSWDRNPDEATILHFRHLLEKHQMTEKPLAAMNKHLADPGSHCARAR